MTTHVSAVLPSTGRGTVNAFALLWSLVVIARTFLHTVVPLQAYDLLGSAQMVSVLYFLASAVGIAGSLSVPWLVQHLRRRWVFSLAAMGMVGSAALLATDTLPGVTAGLMLQIVSVAALDITLNLYVMEHLPRSQFAHYEPTRAFYSAVGYTVGPVMGVWLGREIGGWLPFALSATAALCVLAIFWKLRWSEHPAVRPMRQRPLNPLVYLPRFFSQPRLRLAYLLTCSRSSWWALFAIYAPIYAVQAGFDSVFAGAVVSAGLSSLFFARLWGAVARFYGIRRFLVTFFALGGLATLSVAAVGDRPWLGIALLLLSAFLVTALDGVGNVYFLRAVRPLERAEMTTVFTTCRDVGQTIPPGVLAGLLRVFHLPVVFIAGGLGMLLVAWYARHIPRRL